MIIGTFQFGSSHDIECNYNAILRGINEASEKNVTLLLMQECALCGYFEQIINDENVIILQRRTISKTRYSRKLIKQILL